MITLNKYSFFPVIVSIIFFFSVLVFAFGLMPAGIEAAQGPAEFVLSSIDKGIGLLKESGLQGSEKTEERREKLWSLLKPLFDFEEIAKRALGYHWRNRTPEERKEFTEVFTDILKNTYLSKLDTYRGEKIEYLRQIVSGNRSKVQTYFYTVDGKKLSADFSLILTSDTWKVYDVITEGVSFVSNYRSQFNSILVQSSFEELMQKLKEKRKNPE